MNRRVTQNDVAERAGVSRFTVSSVINNRSGGNIRISGETRQRVLDAVEELGYRPNALARSLRTRRTHLLALLVPDLTNPFYPYFIRGAQEVAQEAGYQILVFDSNNSAEREQGFIESMLQGWIEGVIAVSFRSKEADMQTLLDAGIAVTLLGTHLNLPGVGIVGSGESTAVLEIMRYLIERGHRNIAHLAGPQETPPGRNRLNGYRQALEEVNFPYNPQNVIYGNFTATGMSDLMSSLFKDPRGSNHPTALFAANDVMAIEALQWLHCNGWRVPQDVAVCGFDNIPEASVVVPSLTTIDQNPLDLGRQCARNLVSQIAGETLLDNPAIIPCRLVIRDSA